MLNSWLATPLRLLCIAATAFSLGVGCAGSFYYKPRIQKERSALVHYKAQLAIAHAQLIKAQAKVVIQTEIQYRERIKIVKEKGDTIIKEVPIYVTQADNNHFGVNVGFVRHYNAAFSGEPAGPTAGFDRRPASVSIAEIAETNTFNASVCWQWREQALGLKTFYRQLQQAQQAQQAQQSHHSEGTAFHFGQLNYPD
ncbi:Uncharacterized protein MCB1EB_0391 [Mycoavidus cysteinexigens]|uniref:Uncharacterized protein n=1 Tax=Mycoavidus cysteinexigens TaxID=1553431 RepID=A0A2Z6ET17_9BURK|nr:hypothetical protein [Mycoavidus cysteinexigens]BBE08552.1 Uncharacterized protein MCB1EB_0391 [Mycoavidus cysteinexigens]GAM52741.1 hypothetical protein EBME_1204 [bacterium endosymbiont of Mortierella elongata FMR23-6]GLR01019.1 hypothetical protein GCM10007934_08310 [Mycoavidus cysteinexigens]